MVKAALSVSMARSTYEDFIIKEKIGSGSYGVVFKVVRKVDRVTYAMKEIDLAGMSRKEQEECIRETRVLSSLESDFIIKYYDSFLERGKLYIVTEYAGNGNLHDHIKKQKTRLEEELVWRLFIQILLGLNHMHKKKILHRDVKTLNVFLDDKLNVKLGDMGVAKILSTQTNFAKTIVGTPYYLSPELCEDKPYNEKSDVWALGVVLYECCTQRHPFDADNQGALILKILRGKYPPVNGYSQEMVDIIKRCLTQAASRRPDTNKLLSLPVIREKAMELSIDLPACDVAGAGAALLLAAKAQAGMNVGVQPSSSGAAKVHQSMDWAKPSGSSGAMSNSQRGAGGAALGATSSNRTGKAVRPMSAGVRPSTARPAGEGAPMFKDLRVDSLSDQQEFGATLQSKVPVQQRARTSDPGCEGKGTEGAEGGAEGVADGDGGQPLEAQWRITDAEEYHSDDESPQPPARPQSQAYSAWDAAGDIETMALEEDDGYSRNRPATSRRQHNLTEELIIEDEEDEDQAAAPRPDPVRTQHMQQALLLQKAACQQMIGQKAYDELYALLKSNQVDEHSMTDLSRLVFKIIPYDKSEVIQMMYKLLYLEGQLEPGHTM